jgi:hypothetical protein
MEKRGIPAVLLGSHEFSFLAEREREALGLPELATVYVAHPIGGIDGAIVFERGREVAGQVAEQLLAGTPGQKGDG